MCARPRAAPPERATPSLGRFGGAFGYACVAAKACKAAMLLATAILTAFRMKLFALIRSRDAGGKAWLQAVYKPVLGTRGLDRPFANRTQTIDGPGFHVSARTGAKKVIELDVSIFPTVAAVLVPV